MYKRFGIFLLPGILMHAAHKLISCKMLRLIVVTCLFAGLVLPLPSPSSDYLSKIKVFHFTIHKTKDDTIFSFLYTMDNGKQFTGTATPLHKFSKVFVMMVGNDSFYWVKFSDEDLQKDSFYKAVYDVQLDRENVIVAHLMDDFEFYDIFTDGQVYGGPYAPIWDVDNVAFELADSTTKTFNYAIYSKNNGREVRGTTSYTNYDPHYQKVIVPDHSQCYFFRATFTDAELNSNSIKTIFKPLDQIQLCEIPPAQVSAPGAPYQIDPNLLKSLTG